MKVDLNQIKLYFQEHPWRLWSDEKKGELWVDYDAFGMFRGERVGLARVTIQTKPGRRKDDFWYNLDANPPASRPIVIYQETKKEYRGQGVSGRIIVLANEVSKEKFGQPLSSSTHFLPNEDRTGNYHPHPAIRVWEKLERDGVAYLSPFLIKDLGNSRACKKNDRWVMF